MEGCPFCAIVEGKIPSFKIYEDDLAIAVLDINPANEGHIILFPKAHIKSIMEMSEEAYCRFFILARGLSLALLKFGAEGVNILYPMGAAAGQRTEHMIVHLIPRKEGDKVHLVWEPKKFSEEEFKKIQEEVKRNLPPISLPVKKEEIIKEEKRPEEKVTLEPKTGGYW